MKDERKIKRQKAKIKKGKSVEQKRMKDEKKIKRQKAKIKTGAKSREQKTMKAEEQRT
ncbi:hypothetical protein [Herpetosiphon geysericola]|uniref:hypothetical protein n=1 Tax=Herpetosiphon geysericola TaxID=70996 RepID=UPI001364BD09|nr:hypothetical protein [Herpetosiphon geysericola]